MDKKLIELYYDRPLELSDEQYKTVRAFLDEEHERECAPKIKEREEAIRAWGEKWPNHCRTCRGAGGEVIINYPHSPDDYEPCGDCVGAEDNSYCARCGAVNKNWVDGEDTPCAACGWDWGRGPDDIEPPPYECQHMF